MAAGRGLNFQPFYSHYVLLLTWVLALVGWLIAFFAMCVGEARKNASVSGPLFNTAWFGIFLQLAVMFGFGWGIATDTLPLYQLQLSTFGAVALVFAVSSTNNIFGNGSQQAAGAGWLLLSIADIIWLLFLTSEKPTFLWHSLNSFSHVQITHPSGTRSFPASSGSMRVGGGGNRSSSIQEIHPSSSRSGLGSGGGYYPPHSSSQVKLNGGADQDGGHVASPIGSRRDLESGSVGNGAIGGREVAAGSSVGAAGAGAGEGGFLLKAKALYSYQASPDDPQEMSFTKGEILDIADNSGKWWSARKADGTVGICPSNYLQLIQ